MKSEHLLGIAIGAVSLVAIGYFIGKKRSSGTSNFSNASGNSECRALKDKCLQGSNNTFHHSSDGTCYCTTANVSSQRKCPEGYVWSTGMVPHQCVWGPNYDTKK